LKEKAEDVKQRQAVPLKFIKAYRGVEVQLLSFLTSALYADERSD
jgi:hypothetical protein